MHDASTDELAAYLTDLSAVQDDLLATLAAKRTALLAADAAGLAEVNAREALLADRLRECHLRRERMLERPGRDGAASDSIRTLAAGLPAPARLRIVPRLDAAEHRTRLLQQECLTNWVVVQRTLLHLSQMLEIIATGGRQRPTYGTGDCVHTHGVLVDHAV